MGMNPLALHQNSEPEIVFAMTVVLLKSGEIDILEMTDVEGVEYEMKGNEAIAGITMGEIFKKVAAEQVEIMRMSGGVAGNA